MLWPNYRWLSCLYVHINLNIVSMRPYPYFVFVLITDMECINPLGLLLHLLLMRSRITFLPEIKHLQIFVVPFSWHCACLPYSLRWIEMDIKFCSGTISRTCPFLVCWFLSLYLLGTLTKPNVGEHTQDNNSWVSMAADELRMRLLLCQRSIHSFPTHHNSNMSHMYGRH